MKACEIIVAERKEQLENCKKDLLKKLQVGVPRQAVLADLARRNIDSNLIDLEPGAALPENLQQRPVLVECTELYLDERAFNEHAGSRDYLAAYADAMSPAQIYFRTNGSW